MTIFLENESAGEFPFDLQDVARAVAEAVLEDAGCPYETQVSILVTTEGEMRAINRAQRGIDQATDVLSFPVADYPIPAQFGFLEADHADCFDPDTGELLLGDIAVNADRVRAQAALYGHSLLREYAFLLAHSLLHLIGYDHQSDAQARDMEQKQESLLCALGIFRDGAGHTPEQKEEIG